MHPVSKTFAIQCLLMFPSMFFAALIAYSCFEPIYRIPAMAIIVGTVYITNIIYFNTWDPFIGINHSG